MATRNMSELRSKDEQKGRRAKMKRILVILMAITLLMVLSSCGNKTGIPGLEDVEEWVSPDGVHYWMRNGTYALTITPRYDNDGNLVIEGR